MTQHEELAEQHAIRDLVARYNDAVHRYDEQAWAATWAEDAVWEVGGRRIEGRDNVVEAWLAAMARYDFVALLMHSGHVDIDGDHASGRWYLTEYVHAPDGGFTHMISCYHDTYVKRGGEWQIQSRVYDIAYAGNPPMEGSLKGFEKR